MRQAQFDVAGKKTTLKIPTEKDWFLAVQKIRPLLRPGGILAVQGDLGAGKTTFIQALAAALGVKRFVPSPTFALMRSYKLPKPTNGIRRLIHVDAYRLKDEAELLVLDLDEELADGRSILVLEWPEKVEAWLAGQRDKLTLEIG